MNDSFDTFNSTAGGGGGTATGAGANSETKAEGIVPCLIKQINQSPEGSYQMWGMVFGMVSCVCIVRNIDASSTKITYTLEDHTGQIDAHFWLEEGDTLKAPDVMVNNYAKIFGTTRRHAGKKTLMVFKMVPLKDINELSTHLLEVLMARYKAEEFSKIGRGGNSDFALGGGGGGAAATFHDQTANSLGLEGKHLAIFQCIKSSFDETGVSRQELKSKFSHISASELENIIEFMTQEGHIYTSIDSDHFIATDL